MASKVAIVTGAGSSGPGWGTGKAISVLFARNGLRVLLVDREPNRAGETLAIIREEGGTAEVFTGDVTGRAEMQQMAARALEAFGRIDVLCNNVGIVGTTGLLDVTESEWDRVFAVNLKGALFPSQAVIPAMLRQGGGRLIHISSIAAVRVATVSSYAYSASKAALQQLSRSIAAEFVAKGIRSNCIIPGLIDTPMAAQSSAPGLDDAQRAALVRARDAGSPTGKMGTAWDVAHAALYLASDSANYVNAAEIVVDGGLTAFRASSLPPRPQ